MALFHLILLLFIRICAAQSQTLSPTGEFCNKNAKINSTAVSANIGIVLAKLASGINSRHGFIVSFNGVAGDRVYGLAQCGGDVRSKDCFSCIRRASIEIRKRCPDQADARIWYDNCFLRYDTKNFYGQLDTSFGILLSNVANVTDPDNFNKQLGTLMDKISSKAVMNGGKYFATGKSKLSSSVTLYASVQCTRDLQKRLCSRCLDTAIGNFSGFCKNKQGCQALYSSCRVRYEIYPFLS